MKVKYIKKSSFSLTEDKIYEVISVEKGWYRIIDDTEEDYVVAVKPETESIPDSDNIIEVFTDEVQRIILKLLLKLDKKYE